MTPVLIYHSLLTSASRSSFSAMLCVLTQHLEFFFSSFVRYQFHRKPFRPRILFDMKFLQKGEIPKLWTFKCQVASSWGHRSVETASAEVSSVALRRVGKGNTFDPTISRFSFGSSQKFRVLRCNNLHAPFPSVGALRERKAFYDPITWGKKVLLLSIIQLGFEDC